MPVIQYQRQNRLPSTTSPFIEQSDRGAVGRSISGLGQDVFKRALEKKKEQDTLDANDRYTQLNDLHREFSMEESKLVGKDAEGAVKRRNEWFEKNMSALGKDLNENSKKIFTELARKARHSGMNTAANHEAMEHQKRVQAVAGATLQGWMDRMESGDLSSQTQADAIEESFEAFKFSNPGLSEQQYKNARDQIEDTLIIKRIEGLEKSNPKIALAVLKENEQKLPSKEYTAMKNRLEKANGAVVAYESFEEITATSKDREEANKKASAIKDTKQRMAVRKLVSAHYDAIDKAKEKAEKEFFETLESDVADDIEAGNWVDAQRKINHPRLSRESKITLQDRLDKKMASPWGLTNPLKQNFPDVEKDFWNRIEKDPEGITNAEIEAARNVSLTPATVDKMKSTRKERITTKGKEFTLKIKPGVDLADRLFKAGKFHDPTMEDEIERSVQAQKSYNELMNQYKELAKDYKGVNIVKDILEPLITQYTREHNPWFSANSTYIKAIPKEKPVDPAKTVSQEEIEKLSKEFTEKFKNDPIAEHKKDKDGRHYVVTESGERLYVQ